MSSGDSPAVSVAPLPPEKSEFQLAAEKLRDWKPTEADIAKIIPVVQRSLDTTTKLTEYEDGKAARVLTAMAFVSSMAAAVHNLTVNQSVNSPMLAAAWIHPLYLSYYGAVIIGSLIVLYAVFPRFNIPKKDNPEPFSLIFAPEIVRVKLDAWVNEFTSRAAYELQLRVIRNEVLEARLVAEKCAWKVAKLKQGMRFYVGGLFVLIVALGASFNLLVIQRKAPVVPSKTLLIFDADNTLWDTNGVYANAQAALAKAIADSLGVSAPLDPVAFVRTVEEELAAGGRGFNLPADLVTNTVAQKLAQASGKPTVIASPSALAAAAVAFERGLKQPPALFPSVAETLRRLKNQGYRMVLVSESAPLLLEDRLQQYDVKRYFEHVRTGPKNILVFKETANDYVELVGTNVVSIGDRLDSDVQYAMQAGYKGIWIPGGFKPKEANVAVTPTLALTTFSDLPEKLPAVLLRR